MGLTGVIINVAFYLRPVSTSWIKQKIITAKNIDHVFDIFEKLLTQHTPLHGLIVYQEKIN